MKVTKKVTKGFFWHVHHEKLIEWCFDYNERANYIRADKPENEQETRLRLFKPVRGKLPQEVIESGHIYCKVRQAYDKKVEQAGDKAWQAYNKTRHALDEALSKNMSKIKKLHDKECPNCPWDGLTIFIFSRA